MQKLKVMLLLALMTMLLVVPGVPVVAAMDGDMDGMDDDMEHMNERDVMVNVEPGLIMIHSVLRNGAVLNMLEFFIINQTEGLRIKLQFHSVNGSSQVELELNVVFRALIEFVDMDQDGVYNESVDDEIQYVPLNSFKNVVVVIENVTNTNETKLYFFKLETTDGIFTANIYLAEEFVLVNNTLISPVEMKINLEIDFNFINTSSKLALYVRLESNTGCHEDSETFDEMEGHRTGEEGVSTAMNNTGAFFTWGKTALVDDVVKQVLNSPISTDEGKEKMYLIYSNGSLIFHDPMIGMELPTIVPGGIPFTNGALVFMAISVIAITAWLIRKRTPAKI